MLFRFFIFVFILFNSLHGFSAHASKGKSADRKELKKSSQSSAINALFSSWLKGESRDLEAAKAQCRQCNPAILTEALFSANSKSTSLIHQMLKAKDKAIVYDLLRSLSMVVDFAFADKLTSYSRKDATLLGFFIDHIKIENEDFDLWEEELEIIRKFMFCCNDTICALKAEQAIASKLCSMIRYSNVHRDHEEFQAYVEEMRKSVSQQVTKLLENVESHNSDEDSLGLSHESDTPDEVIPTEKSHSSDEEFSALSQNEDVHQKIKIVFKKKRERDSDSSEPSPKRLKIDSSSSKSEDETNWKNCESCGTRPKLSNSVLCKACTRRKKTNRQCKECPYVFYKEDKKNCPKCSS